jgi:hypothetical protein
MISLHIITLHNQPALVQRFYHSIWKSSTPFSAVTNSSPMTAHLWCKPVDTRHFLNCSYHSIYSCSWSFPQILLSKETDSSHNGLSWPDTRCCLVLPRLLGSLASQRTNGTNLTQNAESTIIILGKIVFCMFLSTAYKTTRKRKLLHIVIALCFFCWIFQGHVQENKPPVNNIESQK